MLGQGDPALDLASLGSCVAWTPLTLVCSPTRSCVWPHAVPSLRTQKHSLFLHVPGARLTREPFVGSLCLLLLHRALLYGRKLRFFLEADCFCSRPSSSLHFKFIHRGSMEQLWPHTTAEAGVGLSAVTVGG